MDDCDCGDCDCDCGDCDCGVCGDCDCDCLGGDCCCGACLEAGYYQDTDGSGCGGVCCCSTTNTNRSCCSTKCCCWFVTALTAAAIAALIVTLVVAYAVVFPARVTVEDAYLTRFALVDGANGTALAYDVLLTVALRNRDFAAGVWKTAPLDVELRFHGQTFARASAQLQSAEWGLFKAKGKGMYRVTASAAGGAPAVVLGGDGVAEFVRESVAGVFELELGVVGGEVKDVERHGKDSSVSVTCPLKLSLPTTATAPVAFTRVKCT